MVRAIYLLPPRSALHSRVEKSSDLPEGVIYEGVEAYGGRPQQFRGETGAQSSIVPALDAMLGVGHKEDALRTYLQEMRTYMPPAHRAFIEALEERGRCGRLSSGPAGER